MSETRITVSATDMASEVLKQITGSMNAMGSSFVARVAEGVLVRDAVRQVISVVKDLVTALPEIAMKGAGVADVEENFKRLSEQAGLLGDRLMGALRTGTHNTITDFDLMKTVNKDLAAGLNLTDQQFGTLAKGAFALAQATGGDVKSALDTMNDAMLTGRTRSLALLTGKIDETAAEEKYAKSLGVSTDQLSEAGKLEAKRIAILEGVGAATTRLGEQTDGLDERVAQLQTGWHNFEEELGKTIATSPVLMAGFDGIQAALREAFGSDQQGLVKGVAAVVDAIVIHVADFGLVTVEAARVGHVAWSAIETVVLGVETAIVGLVTGIGEVLLAGGELAGKLHLVDAAEVQNVRDTQIGLRGMTASLAEQTAAAAQGVIGQSAFDKTLDKVGGSLFAIRDQMVAASRETNTHAEITAIAAKSHEVLSAQVKVNATELKAMAEAWRAYNSVGSDQVATLAAMNAATVEGIKYDLARGEDQGVLQKIYGVTAEQIKAIIAVDKDHAESAKIVEKARAEAAQSTLKWISDELAAELHYAKAVEDATLKQLGTREQLHAEATTAVQRETLKKYDFERAQIAKWVEDQAKTLDTNVDGWEQALDDIDTIAREKYAAVARSEADAFATMKAQEVTWSGGLQKILGGIPNLMVKGLTGGGGMGGVASALTSGLGALGGEKLITAPLTGLFNKAAPALLNTFGMTMTTAIGGAIPFIGPAIGALAPMLIGGIKKLFGGVSEEVLKARSTVADFEAQLASTATAAQRTEAGNQSWKLTVIALRDAYMATGRSEQEALAEAEKLWNSSKSGAAGAKAAIDEINAVLGEQKKRIADANTEFGGLLKSAQGLGGQLPASLQPGVQKLIEMGKLTSDNAGLFASLSGSTEVDFKKMQSIAQKYHVDLKSLGPAFESARLHDLSGTIINDFDMLARGLGGVDSALGLMKKPINDLVRESIKFGVDIPANMKPWVEQLERTGQLTDENGGKLTDLSGLKFSPPIVTEFQKIVDKLQELIDKVTNPLATAIGNIPTQAAAAAGAMRVATDDMITRWGDVEDAVDAVNFGRSPGGIKEIPILAAAGAKSLMDLSTSSEMHLKAIEQGVFGVMDKFGIWKNSMTGAQVDMARWSDGAVLSFGTVRGTIDSVAEAMRGAKLSEQEWGDIKSRYNYTGGAVSGRDANAVLSQLYGVAANADASKGLTATTESLDKLKAKIKGIPTDITALTTALSAFATDATMPGGDGSLPVVKDAIGAISKAIASRDPNSVMSALKFAGAGLGAFQADARQSVDFVGQRGDAMMTHLLELIAAAEIATTKFAADSAAVAAVVASTGGGGVPVGASSGRGIDREPSDGRGIDLDAVSDLIGPQAVHDLAASALRGAGLADSTANLQALAQAAGYTQGTSVSRSWAVGFLNSSAALRAVGLAGIGRADAVSFANEGFDISRPTRAIIGDAHEPESVLKSSTVRELVRQARQGGSGGALSTKALEDKFDAMHRMFKEVVTEMRADRNTMPAMLRHAMRGVR